MAKAKRQNQTEHWVEERTLFGWREVPGKKFKTAAQADRAVSRMNDRKHKQIEAKKQKNRRRFAKFWKQIKSTAKRTASGIRKGVKAAAKLPGKAHKAIAKATDNISKIAHGQRHASPKAASERISPERAARSKQLVEKASRREEELAKEIGKAASEVRKAKSDRKAATKKKDPIDKAIANSPTTAKVRTHKRSIATGKTDVVEHERKLNPKERQAKMAENVAKVQPDAEFDWSGVVDFTKGAQPVDPWQEIEELSEQRI